MGRQAHLARLALVSSAPLLSRSCGSGLDSVLTLDILRLYLEIYHDLPVADLRFREGHLLIHHSKTRMETLFKDQMSSMTLLGTMSSSSTLVVTHRI
jgi:hypothetical protein